MAKKKAVENKAKTLAELRQELLIARKSLHEGTLTNPHAIKAIRKEIARKMTAERSESINEPAAKKGEE
ncbi:50S ribosomal protein L29 [Candidatus Saccharibacteria bacterium]|nr:50S ribosomal protein L29 [Candidatus Saccharibacteria bacterium]